MLDDSFERYVASIRHYVVPTKEEEVALAKRKDRDEKAFEELYVRNLKLVVAIARDMSFDNDLMDTISVGNIGLRKAIERFDYKQGAKLSTYASWWIRQQILRAVPSNRTIKLPIHVASAFSKINKIAIRMAEELGREPTADEMHEETGVSLKKIREWDSMRGMASLNAEIGESGEAFGELIADDHASMASDNIAVGDDFSNVIEAMRACLTDVQYDVLMSRYGLKDGGHGDVLEKIGAKYGVTRERIRQIQNAALQRVRDFLKRNENDLIRDTNPHVKPAVSKSSKVGKRVGRLRLDSGGGSGYKIEGPMAKGWSVRVEARQHPDTRVQRVSAGGRGGLVGPGCETTAGDPRGNKCLAVREAGRVLVGGGNTAAMQPMPAKHQIIRDQEGGIPGRLRARSDDFGLREADRCDAKADSNKSVKGKGTRRAIFCEKHGFSYGSYTNAERNPLLVSQDLLSRIATALKVRYDWLIRGTGEKVLPGNEVNPEFSKGGNPEGLRPCCTREAMGSIPTP